MSVPARLTYIDMIYLKLMSRRSKPARILISYLKNQDGTDLVQVKNLLSIEGRTAPSRFLRICTNLFSGRNTAPVEREIYLIAEYELYYRDCQSARI